jgi:hypothetical protein
MKDKKRFLKRIFIVFAMVLVVSLIYKGYERWPSQNWKEYRSLVRIWPRLKKETIKSIRFTHPTNPQNGLENETFFQEIITTFSFRVRNANIVNEWPTGIEVPDQILPEFIKIINKAMKGKKTSWRHGGNCIWLGRMLIVTNKGKYIVHVETDISEKSGPIVYGEEWISYELGKFLAKYCFPDLKYKYILPPKEQVVAILLYPPKFSYPLAFFGDKKMAEKFLFETEFPDDPNGLQGVGKLYKIARLRKFGIETTIEGKEIIANNELKPNKIFGGRDWLEKIMNSYMAALKEAEEKEKYYPAMPDSIDARLVFMTKDRDYWKEIGLDENTVYDDYIKSEQLKEYFDELGLTKELLAKKPIKVSQD